MCKGLARALSRLQPRLVCSAAAAVPAHQAGTPPRPSRPALATRRARAAGARAAAAPARPPPHPLSHTCTTTTTRTNRQVERVRFSKDGSQLQLTAVDGRRALVVLPNDPELVDILARNGVDISGGCWG